MTEEWRPIKGYEGRYEISNTGIVKALKGRRKEHIMFQRMLGDYLATGLYDGKQQKDKTIHRLVAEAFIPNPQNKRDVNHIDGCKTNNNVTNLEWATPSENQIHSQQVLKNLNGRSKFSPEQLQDILRRGKTESGAAIARDLGVSKSCICRILNGTTYRPSLAS